MAIAWAIAVASAVLGADLRVEGGVRAEGRSRTLDARGQERLTTAEVSLTPRVAAELVGPDVDLRAQYVPTLRAPDVLTSLSPDVLHAAELRARLRLLPTWSLTGVAGGERGTTDLVAESRLRQAVPDAVPTTAQLRYASAHADLAANGSVDPRTTVTVTAGGFVGGGDDAPSREVLPIERGLRGSATLEWSATRLDALALQTSGLGVRFMGDRQAALATLTAGWLRHLERTVEARVRGGALASWSDAPGESAQRAILPTGELGVAHASERLHTAEDAVVRLGAGVDRLSGTVDRQVEVTASTRWAPSSAWSFAGSAAAAFVRQGPIDSQRGALELRAEWALSAQISAAFGLYGHWQHTPDPALPSFVEWGGLLSIGVDVPRRGPAGVR